MDAGASVLAFVGVALSGTKVLYETISSLGHADEGIADLSSAVENLQMILTQLSNCRALEDSETDTRNLTSLIKACEKDVDRMQRHLKKFKPSSASSNIQRTWKKFRAVLSSKDLDTMWNRVNHHCIVLQSQLSFLQR